MSPQALLGVPFWAWGPVESRFRGAPADEAARARKNRSRDFVRRKFGHEILEYLVTPFVSGVYAGDPEKLSLRAAFPSLDEWEREYGSVLRGAMKSRPAKGAGRGPPPLCSFHRGMATLTRPWRKPRRKRAAGRARRCRRLERRSGGRAQYQVRVTQNGREETIAARAVVIATPAYVASHLVAPVSARRSRRRFRASCTQRWPWSRADTTKQQIGTAPEGLRRPRSRAARSYRTLGIVWNSSLFPDRGGEGRDAHDQLRRAARPIRRCEKPDEEILRSSREKARRFWRSPARRSHRESGSIPRRCRNTISDTATPSRRSAMRARDPGLYFRRELPRRAVDRKMRRASLSDRRGRPQVPPALKTRRPLRKTIPRAAHAP